MQRAQQIKQAGQKGIALLLLVVSVALAAISYFVAEMSTAEIRLERIDATGKALQRAKQALIAYAVTYGDIDADANGLPDFPGEYGYLPCPDYNAGLAEGIEDSGNCGARSVSKLGYLPWRTLGLPGLKDESGTCLMYAVSGDYKNDESAFPSNKALLLNEDSNGMFQVVDDSGAVLEGVNPDDRIVAIILAPGKPLPGYGRSVNPAGSVCGFEYTNYPAYLDAAGIFDNSSLAALPYQVDQFIHATAETVSDTAPNPYNDRFVTISRDEIWQALTARPDFVQKITNLTEALAMCLGDYAAVNGLGRLPWPVQADLADYQQNASYNDNADESPGYAGRLPFIVDDSNDEIGVAGSAELFTLAACNALTVASGAVVDLQTPGAEYRKLWDNWKDHFFYVVSQDHAPDNVAATCGSDCITVNGVQRAGLVVFGGFREAGQVRIEPVAGDPDTKRDVASYMENANRNEFPDSDGDGAYSTAGTNDIMYCLTATVPPVTSAC